MSARRPVAALFSTGERHDTHPKPHSEPSFDYLDRSARPEAACIRSLLEDWFARYPTDQRSEFANRFCSSSDSEHVSASFELYLHELLLRLGYRVEVHPVNPSGRSTRPDFRACGPDGNSVFIEAASTSSELQRKLERNPDVMAVADAINSLESSNFYVALTATGKPRSTPSISRIRSFLKAWINQLDADTVFRAMESGGEGDLPEVAYQHDDFVLKFRAIPRAPNRRGDHVTRPLAYFSTGVFLDTSWELVRDVLRKKAKRYGDMQAPFIVCINVGDFAFHEIDSMNALFGQEFVQYDVNTGDMRPGRHWNGLWRGPKGARNLRVSAVLVAPDVQPWTLGQRLIRLYHCPVARYPCSGAIDRLGHRKAVGASYPLREGDTPTALLQLREGWPTVC